MHTADLPASSATSVIASAAGRSRMNITLVSTSWIPAVIFST
jgi:hypothetical protein